MRLALLCIAVPLAAQSLTSSQVALGAATVADVLSSRGGYERNPILGRGEFRMGNQGAKALAITGGLILAERLIVRRWPESRRVFRWVNFGGTAAHGAAAAHNWSQ